MNKKKFLFKKRHNNSMIKKKKKRKKENKLKKRIEELLSNYENMSEATALEIATGVYSLDLWNQKEEEKRWINEKINEIEKIENEFNSNLSIYGAVEILKGAYSLKEYKEQKLLNIGINEKAEELAKKENIPLFIAKNIVNKKFTLEDYLEKVRKKEERKKKALEIHQKYPDIALGSCYLIVDEGITVEEFLERREKNKERRKQWFKNYLKENIEDNKLLALYLSKIRSKKTPIFISVFNHESNIGTLISYTPYEIKIKDKEEKEVLYPKLKLKFICKFSYADKILSSIELDKERANSPILPSLNPKERYSIPEEFLQEGKKIKLTLGEGEIIKGTIKWATKYDIKLSPIIYPRFNVIVFRHAVINAELLNNTVEKNKVEKNEKE